MHNLRTRSLTIIKAKLIGIPHIHIFVHLYLGMNLREVAFHTLHVCTERFAMDTMKFQVVSFLKASEPPNLNLMEKLSPSAKSILDSSCNSCACFLMIPLLTRISIVIFFTKQVHSGASRRGPAELLTDSFFIQTAEASVRTVCFDPITREILFWFGSIGQMKLGFGPICKGLLGSRLVRSLDSFTLLNNLLLLAYI